MRTKEKVTVYFNTGMCGMGKVEGTLAEVNPSLNQAGLGSVSVIKKRCRKATVFGTYYHPYILVLKGWDRPDPPSAWETPVVSNGCVVTKSKYMSCDPRIEEDFHSAVTYAPEDVVAEFGKN